MEVSREWYRREGVMTGFTQYVVTMDSAFINYGSRITQLI